MNSHNLFHHEIPHAAVPLDWLNSRLAHLGASWRVQTDEYDEFQFFESTSTSSGAIVQPSHLEVIATEPDAESRKVIPKGLALVICVGTQWKNTQPNASRHYNLLGTFDSIDFDHFPNTFGPCAAYVLIWRRHCYRIADSRSSKW